MSGAYPKRRALYKAHLPPNKILSGTLKLKRKRVLRLTLPDEAK